MGDGAFDAWVAEEFPNLVGGPKSLMRDAWHAAKEWAAKMAEEYAASRKRLDEQWTAEEVAARIRGGA
jgi:hypothetical protein